MSILDPKYMIAPSLEEYFVNKATGLPLAGGKVYFYSDINRTTPKAIYKLSGSPGSYTYDVINNNPMILTSVGTASDDLGNDIKIYYYPYDSNGAVELYFIQVYDSTGAFQWSRSAWPNTIAGEQDAQSLVNFVPNGQFLLHNNIPATNTTIAGQITQAVTYIAPGGWSFRRPGGSAAVDVVLFTQLGPVTTPTGNPRYVMSVSNTSISSGDAYKNLVLRFTDVNSFASDTQYYTIAFTGETTGGTIPVTLSITKNYGTGGSPDTTVVETTFNLTATYAIWSFATLFGSNIGKTIGSLNDDYVDIIFGFPTGSIFSLNLTDFIITPGNVTITTYPDTPDSEVITASTIGQLPTPAYDGSQLYLPIVLTPQGTSVLTSQIGCLFANTTGTPGIDELIADGTGYQTSLYNATSGIPYSRLQAKYWNSSTNIPRYGTGPTYVMAYISAGNTAQIYLTTNVNGAVTAPTEGSVVTNFAIAVTHAGDASAFGVKTAVDTGGFWVIGSAPGIFTGSALGTITFTPTVYKNESASGFSAVQWATVAGSGLAGLYFEFYLTVLKYVWYRVNTTGADPAPGGGATGIRVDLLSTDTAQDVAMKSASAIAGYQGYTIICGAASTFSGGAYFTFTASTQIYAVWYKKDGAGTRPVVSNALYIEVDVLSTDTAAQVASKTQAGINGFYVAVPDARGLFLRGYDATQQWDTLPTHRFNLVNYSSYGPALGTTEIDTLYSHLHGNGLTLGSGTITSGGSGGNQTNTALAGQAETRPVNLNVLWVIKY